MSVDSPRPVGAWVVVESYWQFGRIGAKGIPFIFDQYRVFRATVSFFDPQVRDAGWDVGVGEPSASVAG